MRTPTGARIGSGIGSPPTTPARENSTPREVPLYKSAKTGLLLVDDSQWNAKQERIMSQFELDERTRAVLDRVRHSTATLSVYDMPPDLAEATDRPSHSGLRIVDSRLAYTQIWGSRSRT
jgi:hypothetical protein